MSLWAKEKNAGFDLILALRHNVCQFPDTGTGAGAFGMRKHEQLWSLSAVHQGALFRPLFGRMPCLSRTGVITGDETQAGKYGHDPYKT